MKVGLEIHGYLNCAQKLFCTCTIDPNSTPNTNICPICTAQPGSKPMLPNKQALHHVIAIGLFFNCKINTRLQFQRKHYNWPDLPTGYQRTMSGAYSTPTAEDGTFLGINIREIHLEEDPARWDPGTGLVDYNRSGYPLVEIVTEPDFTSIEQVTEWLEQLFTALSYINTINPSAGIKCDVNINIEGHPRVEVKNVNSFTSIAAAIAYEIKRQETATKEERIQQTRAFDARTGVTSYMRSKENAQEYRFIPEPDLPIILIIDEDTARIAASLPETPTTKFERYLKRSVDPVDAKTISSNVALAELFDAILALQEKNKTHTTHDNTNNTTENTAQKNNDAKNIGHWFRRDIMNILNTTANALSRDDVERKKQPLNTWFTLVFNNAISAPTAKELLAKVLLEEIDAEQYAKQHDLFITSDNTLIEQLCKQIIAQNEKSVQEYKEGNEKAFNNLVGAVMTTVKGKASPQEVAKTMKQMLDER